MGGWGMSLGVACLAIAVSMDARVPANGQTCNPECLRQEQCQNCNSGPCCVRGGDQRPLVSTPSSTIPAIRIGLVAPITGPLGPLVGQQIVAGARLFVAVHDTPVSGTRIELLIKDTGGDPVRAKATTQELIQRDRAAVIAIVGSGPASAIISDATEARVPIVLMANGTSMITQRSPYFVRSSFTYFQASKAISDWAISNNIRNVVTVVSDSPFGTEVQASFKSTFGEAGGNVVTEIKVPLNSRDLASVLQDLASVLNVATNARPHAIIAFVPSFQLNNLMQHVAALGAAAAGMKLVGGLNEITDDDLIGVPHSALTNTVTAHFYSVDGNSETNRAFVAAFARENAKMPNSLAVEGYDAMRLIYAALQNTRGDTNGDRLINAMSGAWESPRGPMSIDPQTRDVTQNMYMRGIERRDGRLSNVPIATFKSIRASR
jgi:branched-chain amino acid transport system substrate-binding protein